MYCYSFFWRNLFIGKGKKDILTTSDGIRSGFNERTMEEDRKAIEDTKECPRRVMMMIILSTNFQLPKWNLVLHTHPSSLSLSHSLFLVPIPPYTHPPSLSLSLSLAHILSHSCTHPYTSVSLSLSLSLTHTHTLSLSHTHSLSLSHRHRHTQHTRTHVLSLSLPIFESCNFDLRMFKKNARLFFWLGFLLKWCKVLTDFLLRPLPKRVGFQLFRRNSFKW